MQASGEGCRWTLYARCHWFTVQASPPEEICGNRLCHGQRSHDSCGARSYDIALAVAELWYLRARTLSVQSDRDRSYVNPANFLSARYFLEGNWEKMHKLLVHRHMSRGVRHCETIGSNFVSQGRAKVGLQDDQFNNGLDRG